MNCARRGLRHVHRIRQMMDTGCGALSHIARSGRPAAARRLCHENTPLPRYNGRAMSKVVPFHPTAPLTDLQERFSYGLSLGLGPTEAARCAGYANPSVAGARLGQDPRVRAIIRQRRNRRIDKMASLSLWELGQLVRNAKSEAVQFRAIELSLSLAGHVAPKAPESEDSEHRPIEEMSVAELDAFIAAEKAKRANAARPVIDGKATTSDAVAPYDGDRADRA